MKSMGAARQHCSARTNAAPMRALVIGCILLAGATSARAQEEATSAGDIVRGCRLGVSYYKSPPELVQQGFCAGIVSGIRDVAATAQLACFPPNVSLDTIIRKTVQYVDARPSRIRESFSQLVLESLSVHLALFKSMIRISPGKQHDLLLEAVLLCGLASASADGRIS